MQIFSSKQSFFDWWASFYDCPLTSIYYQTLHQQLLRHLALPAAAKVLDLGCGTGRLLNHLARQYPDLWGVGLDFSPIMLKQARRTKRYRSQLIFVQGDAAPLRFSSDFFDAVFCSFSLLHYPHPDQVFQEVHRVLNPGGYFYLVDLHPQGLDPVGRWPVTPGGITFYNASARQIYGHQAGLVCLQHLELMYPTLGSIFVKPIV